MAGSLKLDGNEFLVKEGGQFKITNSELKLKSSGNTVVDSSGNALISEANGVVTMSDKMVPANSFMFRNKIINGSMQVSQRGASHQHDIYGATPPYNLDRFCSGRANVTNNGNAIITAITGGGQRHDIHQASGTLASSVYFTIRQHIEGLNCFDLAGKQATISFKVKTNKAGNYGVSFYDGTGSATITPQSITVSSSDASAENKVSYSKTFTMPSSITADNASRLRLDICLSAHSNRAGEYYPTGGSQVNLFDSTSNYFEIYEIQLEAGSSATPFEHRPADIEFSLCKRYYEIGYFSALGYVQGSTYQSGGNVHWHEKRAVPTLTWSNVRDGGTNNYSGTDGGNINYLTTTSGLFATQGASSGNTHVLKSKWFIESEI